MPSVNLNKRNSYLHLQIKHSFWSMLCMLLLVSQAKRLLSSPHNGHQPGFTLLLLVLNIICPSCWAERHQKIYILKCLQICSSGQVTCHLLCVAGCWSWWRNGHNLVSWIVLSCSICDSRSILYLLQLLYNFQCHGQ